MKIYSKGFWSLTNILISIPLDELATNLHFLSSCRSQKHCFKQLKWFTSTKEVKRQIIKLRLENSVKIKTWKTWDDYPQPGGDVSQQDPIPGPSTAWNENYNVSWFLILFAYKQRDQKRTDTSQALHPYRGKERQDSSGRSQIRPPSHGGEGSLQPGTSSSAWTSWVSLTAGSPAQCSSVFPSTPAT